MTGIYALSKGRKALLFVSRIFVEFHLLLKIHKNAEELSKCGIYFKFFESFEKIDNIMLKFTLCYRPLLSNQSKVFAKI